MEVGATGDSGDGSVDLSESEVGYLGDPGVVQEDVQAFQIAM